MSLRGVNGFRVNDLAKTYGGGGHPAAAGFTCAELPWKIEDEDPWKSGE
jgi:nanoRNase/pAp phosphatase (c-di-AMP/oligoRNAs hydrolase)